MKNLHLLTTDKPSRLWITWEKQLGLHPTITNSLLDKQHIYITSDEEIKKGDWYLFKIIGAPFDYRIHYCKDITDEGYVLSEKELNCDLLDCRKIILTTDQDLIKDGVQSIDDEFLEWFVKNPSCESVQYYTVSSNTISTTITRYKIIIPQEEPKQENCCPKCGELENFHYNYDYSKVEKVHILDILCNECGELFPPILKLPKQKVMKTAMQELIDWATSLQYNQQQCIDWITIKNKAEQLLEKEEPKQEFLEKISSIDLSPEFQQLISDNLDDLTKYEPKQETLEEAALRKYPLNYHTSQHNPNNILKRDIFKEGAKWQEERIPSIIEEYLETAFISKEQGYMNPKEWFEQFKK
jgi:hypothetical protein